MPSPKEMIENSLVAAVVTDPRLPDNPIIECNQAFLSLTGYAREEVIGRNCKFLRGEETEAQQTEQLRQAVKSGQPAMVDILNYRKDGTAFRNAVMIAPIFDGEGGICYFLGTQVEVNGEASPMAPGKREQAQERIGALSDRQRQILLEMAAGKLNKQIAWELNLSERTIKMHRAAVLKALGVRTSADAIRVAVEAGY